MKILTRNMQSSITVNERAESLPQIIRQKRRLRAGMLQSLNLEKGDYQTGPASIHMERFQPDQILSKVNDSVSKKSITTRKSTKLSKSINPSYASNVSNI